MLCDDLAHIPPSALERAIDQHVLTSPFMPKAADLIKLAQNDSRPASLLPTYGQTYADALAESYNAKCAFEDVVWISNGRDVRIAHKATSPYRPGWKPEPGEIDMINDRIAGYILQGMTQEQFNALVDSGKFA